jgi:hypothetical protein
MDYRQWAQDQDGIVDGSWPLPYNHEFARLRNQRLEEFRNTMDVNFGWLQDYYEGFRWAAMQRRYTFLEQSTMRYCAYEIQAMNNKQKVEIVTLCCSVLLRLRSDPARVQQTRQRTHQEEAGYPVSQCD